jgi:hypothetical protein
LPALELRPRHGTEIVDASFQLYRRHFRALIMMNAIVNAPFVVLLYILREGFFGRPAPSLILEVVIIIGLMLGTFSKAAIVLAVSNSYLQGELDTTATLRATLRRFGTILVAVFLKYLLIGLSMLALPLLVYVSARYFAVPATVILEGLGVRAGLRRSADLSRDFKRKVCVTLGLPFVLLTIIHLTLVQVASELPGPAILSFVATRVPSLVLAPIPPIITTLLYYDARIRKEGFDIEMMAGELGSAEPNDSSSQLPVSS